jgi:Protein of unknown function (DUF2798).
MKMWELAYTVAIPVVMAIMPVIKKTIAKYVID